MFKKESLETIVKFKGKHDFLRQPVSQATKVSNVKIWKRFSRPLIKIDD